MYVIVVNDLDLEAEINKSKLENPEFNLIEWYVKYIEFNCN